MPKSQVRSVTQQNQTLRIDRDIDSYTSKLQIQRKKKMNLKMLHRQIELDLQNIKAQVARKRRQRQESKARKALAFQKTLMNKLDMYSNKTNHIIGLIGETKDRIDKLRRERTNFIVIFKQIEAEMKGIEQINRRKQEEVSALASNYQSNKAEIIQEKLKFDSEISKIDNQITHLQSQIDKTPTVLELKNSAVKRQVSSLDTLDTASILKKRLQKLILNNKEKVKIIDVYQRNMGVIDQAFNSIKEATGLTDIQEIQNTFIKSEQQNCGLLTYLDVLNQDIDFLIDQNQWLQKKCADQDNQNQERLRILQGTPDEQKRRKRLNKLIDRKSESIQDLSHIMKDLTSAFQNMFRQCSKSVIQTDKVKQFQYQSGISINQSNFQQHLAQYEAYVDKILSYRAYLNNVSLFSAEGLTERQDKRMQMNFSNVMTSQEGLDQNDFLQQKQLQKRAKESLKSVEERRKKK